MGTNPATALVPGGTLAQPPAAEVLVPRTKPVRAPMAHVPFCFYCEMFTVPLGAKCGAVYPRE